MQFLSIASLVPPFVILDCNIFGLSACFSLPFFPQNVYEFPLVWGIHKGKLNLHNCACVFSLNSF